MNVDKGYIDSHCTILTIFKNKKLGKANQKKGKFYLTKN